MMIFLDCKCDFWMLFENLSFIELKNGDDILIILDINIQDIIEEVLLKGMQMYDVDWGVVMVMEVNMGVIKVIVNIE